MTAARQVWDGWGIVYNNAPPEAHQTPTFASWVKDIYVDRQAMAIRRQVDTHHDVVSIARLIDHVGRYPQVLSRDRYAHGSAGWASRPEADRLFDQMVGEERDHMDPNIAKADLAKLRTRTSNITRYATNEIAHYNRAKGTFGEGLTMGDIHGAIDLIIDLSVKYRDLILASSMAKTVSIYPWIQIFRVAWISHPGSHPQRVVAGGVPGIARRPRHRDRGRHGQHRGRSPETKDHLTARRTGRRIASGPSPRTRTTSRASPGSSLTPNSLKWPRAWPRSSSSDV